ncbi:MAG: hypothetical protein ACRD88_02905 [Terriglobia bacterium]
MTRIARYQTSLAFACLSICWTTSVRAQPCGFFDPPCSGAWMDEFGPPVDGDEGITGDVERTFTNSRIYLAGTKRNPVSAPAVAYVRGYNNSGQLPVWDQVFSYGTRGDTFATGVTTNSSSSSSRFGHGYVCGWTTAEGTAIVSAKSYCRSYDENGNLVWDTDFRFGDQDFASRVSYDSEGLAMFVTGYRIKEDTCARVPFLVKIRQDGTLVWQTRLGP